MANDIKNDAHNVAIENFDGWFLVILAKWDKQSILGVKFTVRTNKFQKKDF